MGRNIFRRFNLRQWYNKFELILFFNVEEGSHQIMRGKRKRSGGQLFNVRGTTPYTHTHDGYMIILISVYKSCQIKGNIIL